MPMIQKITAGLLTLCLILGMALAGTAFVIGAKGYGLYRQAGGAAALMEMAQTIREEEHFVPLETLPETYINAVIATEDKRFFRHFGIDPIAIARAFVHNVQAGQIAEGGSTITQQLAKNQFFTQEQHFSRKAAEVFMSFALERQFTKEEILELYLNSIYFGEGYYGIGQASLGYFGMAAEQLGDYECTLLAGLPNAPSVYALSENPHLAEQRQAQVLRQMVEEGYIGVQEAKAVLAAGG
ncbi:transglycosylase domain-containing protein [Ruminococcaceae bacterium OttesenSCG-928-I18]|nr:transglycosylase domain-containing protein [Ruminococcaceae bacterium OttesenSCG-928-I18]